jgi:hypothetical protein
MDMPRSARSDQRCSFSLDTWVLMDSALRLGKRTIYDWSFVLDKCSISHCKPNKRPPEAGMIRLCLDWPRKHQAPANGFAVVSHPNWKTLPRIVLLVGIPNIDGGWVWRFLCPITRKLVQVVFYDEESQLFVSPAARGRRQRRSDVRRFLRHIGHALEQLEHKYGDLEQKPAGMSDGTFSLLKEVADSHHVDFHLSASGVPEAILNDTGSFDVVAMSKQHAVRKNTAGAGTYYRDRSGVLKLTARSKKRLGIT